MTNLFIFSKKFLHKTILAEHMLHRLVKEKFQKLVSGAIDSMFVNGDFLIIHLSDVG